MAPVAFSTAGMAMRLMLDLIQWWLGASTLGAANELVESLNYQYHAQKYHVESRCHFRKIG
ncbi:hypothetical protein BCAR13_860062 [Paraburkholderia caribensis]|nr:hypothetical protein BCAR13_860062 [Paraburkholderia caribensis]